MSWQHCKHVSLHAVSVMLNVKAWMQTLMVTIAVVEVGALYELSIMPDYSDMVFKFKLSKLIQQDFRCLNETLIALWEAFEDLRPGTVILANCSLHCFIWRSEKVPCKVLIIICSICHHANRCYYKDLPAYSAQHQCHRGIGCGTLHAIYSHCCASAADSIADHEHCRQRPGFDGFARSSQCVQKISNEAQVCERSP